ncbi:uncharacterized protein TRUGW13939_05821 [Talaromyces rugulosus]|uniref:BYS1 domain protein n=1 Tax=Talaromyces rugulosus TaxID=121627 RepID=A0A7H8QX61_TALRU|nr:uncharacterized protein TRUGW13939_05821 [Talaromyces rugulosus]QKX58694.1 hypothetical protein TRUGW13939_05821 [Talaromyces rugulosus]
MNFILLALTSILPLTQAVGNAIILNNCTDTTAYVWSVGSSIGKTQTLATGETFNEEFHYDSTTGGITLKITTERGGIYQNSPETDYAYTLDTNTSTVWYAISDVNGDPFANNTVALVPDQDSCVSYVWEDGVPPSGIHTASCSADGDIKLILCQEG